GPLRGDPLRGEPRQGDPQRGEPLRGGPPRGEFTRSKSVRNHVWNGRSFVCYWAGDLQTLGPERHRFSNPAKIRSLAFVVFAGGWPSRFIDRIRAVPPEPAHPMVQLLHQLFEQGRGFCGTASGGPAKQRGPVLVCSARFADWREDIGRDR